MVHDPIQSNADETPGKYHDSKPLLFSNLLNEQTKADRDVLKYRSTDTQTSPSNSASDEAPASREESDTHNQRPPDNTGPRQSPMEAVPQEDLLRQYLSESAPVAAYGGTKTGHEHPRYYTLQQLSYDGRAYYCLICQEYTSTLAGTVNLVAVGTGVDFEPVHLDAGVLVEAVEDARRVAYREARQPVARLREPQLSALNGAYQRVVEARFTQSVERAESGYRESHPFVVLDQFAIASDIVGDIQRRVLDQVLSSRQRTVVAAAFTNALRAGSDIPEWVWDQEVDIDLPAIAGIRLPLSPPRHATT